MCILIPLPSLRKPPTLQSRTLLHCLDSIIQLSLRMRKQSAPQFWPSFPHHFLFSQSSRLSSLAFVPSSNSPLTLFPWHSAQLLSPNIFGHDQPHASCEALRATGQAVLLHSRIALPLEFFCKRVCTPQCREFKPSWALRISDLIASREGL